MKRSVKAIRRQYKAMKTEADLLEGVSIGISRRDGGILIEYVDKNGLPIMNNKGNLGAIFIIGEENSCWQVAGVKAQHGYGPLLYDIAMEYATQHGSGISADKHDPVSIDARKVWDHYYQNRPDVDKVEYFSELPSSPTNFLYRKQPDRISKLRESNRLIEETEY